MWSTVSVRARSARQCTTPAAVPLHHQAVPLPKLQVDALLSPVGCEIEPGADHFEKCPVGGALLDMRDQAQMLAHVHDAEIEICGGPGPPRPVALDLKAKPIGKPSGNL
jgi:hypothetical protein